MGQVTPQADEKPLTGKERLEAAEARAEAAERRAEAAEGALTGFEERMRAMESRLLHEAPRDADAKEGPQPDIDQNAPKFRGFICPQSPNGQWLVEPGVLEQVNDPNAPLGKRDHQRRGDIKLKFTEGQCLLNEDDPEDQVRIGFMLARPETFRDVMDVGAEIWFKLKQSQVHTSRSEPGIGGEVDVDAVMRGDINALAAGDPSGLGVVDSLRKQVAGVH